MTNDELMIWRVRADYLTLQAAEKLEQESARRLANAQELVLSIRRAFEQSRMELQERAIGYRWDMENEISVKL